MCQAQSFCVAILDYAGRHLVCTGSVSVVFLFFGMGALPSPCIACGSEIWNFLDDDFVNNMVEGIQKLVAALGALDDDLLHG